MTQQKHYQWSVKTKMWTRVIKEEMGREELGTVNINKEEQTRGGLYYTKNLNR